MAGSRGARQLLKARSLLNKSSHRPTFLCSTCRDQMNHYSSTPPQAGTKTDDKKSLTDTITHKLRKKIWGTENPPGLPDPYSRTQAAERADQLEREAREAQTADLSTGTQEGRRPQRLGRRDYAIKEHEVGIPELLPHPLPTVQVANYGPQTALRDNQMITAALHRALVEVYTLHQAGISPLDVEATGEDQTQAVQIVPNGSGGIRLEYPEGISAQNLLDNIRLPVAESDVEEDSEHQLYDGLSESSTAADKEGSPAQMENGEQLEDQKEQGSSGLVAGAALVSTWDKSWLKTPLGELNVKFSILRRITQLTGLRIRDSDIRGVSTAGTLLALLCSKPRPAKLVEELVQAEQLMELPNVSVYGKKITKMDKEIQVGRWKLIEEEFKRRDLPLEYPR